MVQAPMVSAVIKSKNSSRELVTKGDGCTLTKGGRAENAGRPARFWRFLDNVFN